MSNQSLPIAEKPTCSAVRLQPRGGEGVSGSSRSEDWPRTGGATLIETVLVIADRAPGVMAAACAAISGARPAADTE